MKKSIDQSLFILLLILSFIPFAHSAEHYFTIKIVDKATNRGIPMVELKTLNHIRYYSDSNGIIAFYEPGLMDQQVYFLVRSPGYISEAPEYKFGYRGIVLTTVSNDSSVVQLKRINIAERLYRTTGGGIYRDSYLTKTSAPGHHPLLNSQVLGQDSILGALFKDKIFWIWGDTFKAAHPLGNFSIAAATSELPGSSIISHEKSVNYAYFTDSTGFSKTMINLQGPGYVWFDWILTLDDEVNGERLVAKYARVNVQFENYERGIALYDEDAQEFRKYRETPEWIDEYHSTHHPFQAHIKGLDYFYFTSEFKFHRVRANMIDITNPESYESFTCLKSGTKYRHANSMIHRDIDGRPVYAWKQFTDGISLQQQEELIKAGLIKQNEAWIQLRDINTGEKIVVKRGSIFWNEYRKRWIMIAGKILGEVWFAEADTPVGPWVYAVRIAIHDMNFYNPTHHPFFDQDEGRLIYFEGTYASAFAGNVEPVPRYEYNQLMYLLRLDDPRLSLPAPVYSVINDKGDVNYCMRDEVDQKDFWNRIKEICFFAIPPERSHKGLIPVYKRMCDGKAELKTIGHGDPLFYALPERVTNKRNDNQEKPDLIRRLSSTDITPLYSYALRNKSCFSYTTSLDFDKNISYNAVCDVWINPYSLLILDHDVTQK